MSTTDFEEIVSLWLNADDGWKDVFRNDDEAITNKHWFETYSYRMNNRWGYLLASIVGSQNGVGQFHKNAYTVDKIRSILDRLGLEEVSCKKVLERR